MQRRHGNHGTTLGLAAFQCRALQSRQQISGHHGCGIAHIHGLRGFRGTHRIRHAHDIHGDIRVGEDKRGCHLCRDGADAEQVFRLRRGIQRISHIRLGNPAAQHLADNQRFRLIRQQPALAVIYLGLNVSPRHFNIVGNFIKADDLRRRRALRRCGVGHVTLPSSQARLSPALRPPARPERAPGHRTTAAAR